MILGSTSIFFIGKDCMFPSFYNRLITTEGRRVALINPTEMCSHSRSPSLCRRLLTAKTGGLPSILEPFPASGLYLPRLIPAPTSGSERVVLPCFELVEHQPLDHGHTWPRALPPFRLRLSTSVNDFVKGKLARLYETQWLAFSR